MTDPDTRFRSVVLAGERPGGSPLSKAFGVAASVMVPVAGRPALSWVLEAIRHSHHADDPLICGPSEKVVRHDTGLREVLRQSRYGWLAPASGPADSALSAVRTVNEYPTLVTTGDHALLTGEVIDRFCRRANRYASQTDADFVIGFVPHALVRARWPESRRTVLKFSNGRFCGSNLFAVMSPNGLSALAFWRQSEADRKRPWRIARRFGPSVLLRYVFRRLSLEETLRFLSDVAGCRIGHVQVDDARAAVDVDTVADQQLAENILSA